MKLRDSVLLLSAGLSLGGLMAALYFGQPRDARAASNDRYQDFVMATGAVNVNPRIQTDGVWMLDYKTGKLLGTVIDKTQGKVIGWAEVDLVEEFQVQPKQDVHFMMTTGYITHGQSALYLAETTTGQFGVYTMAAGPVAQGSIVIKRHDLSSFRKVIAPPAQPAPPVGGAVPAPPILPPAAPGNPLPIPNPRVGGLPGLPR